MNKSKKTELILGVVGFLSIAVAIFGIYKIIQSLLNIFAQLNPTVVAGIIAATATIMVSVFSVLVAKHLEQKAVLLKEHRERKTPIYEEMVKLIFRFAFAEKIGLPPLTEKELTAKMAWITENLVVWGSDDLLIAWNRFRTYSINHSENSKFDVLFEVEKLLLAIRKDLGHSNRGIVKGKILGLFVNDIKEYL